MINIEKAVVFLI